jgi:ribosomal protein S12 methylthiotransferase accessory factor
MNLKEKLILESANFRHGLVLPPQNVRRTFADIEEVESSAVPQNSSEPWESASGGIGRDEKTAKLAAIGEALERYSAYAFRLPIKEKKQIKGKIIELEQFSLFSEDQTKDRDFPYTQYYGEENNYTNVFSIFDNEEYWVPEALVGLDNTERGPFSTSTGLACASTKYHALLRALQEVIERDALVTTWIHGIPGRQIKLDNSYTEEVKEKRGEALCIDATPEYSSHPVALVAGCLPLRGKKRISLGAACRETWEEAVEKAYLEWVQGIMFAGYYSSFHPHLEYRTFDDVKTFDDHAVFYTVHPEMWKKVPLTRGEQFEQKNKYLESSSARESIEKLIRRLKNNNVRIYYRELTTVDLRQIGAYVFRVLSPDLTPIHFRQKYPFLGGNTNKVYWRYPWARKYKLLFPNPYPHPLG